jgi:hypothetical protein
MGMSIPIIAIVMGIGIAMLSVVLDYRKKREIFEMHHKERMAAIDKGMEVPPLPPEFFQDGRRRCGPQSNLRRGLVLLFVGVAVTVAMSANDSRHALWGLVPAAVGVANLLVYFIEGRRAPHSDDSRQ